MQSSRSSDWKRRAALGTAIASCVANLVLHFWISSLCDALYRYLGRATYEWTTLCGIAALSVAAAALVLRRRLRALLRPAWLAITLGLAVLTAAAQWTLLVSNIEVIHFPQFALLAALFLAAGLDPMAAWLAASAAGIADEAYQRYVIYPAIPNVYLDFNDMVLNAIGAAWAVVLAAGTRTGDAPRPRGRSSTAWMACIAAASVLALWLDPPRLHPFLHRAMTGRAYHVMSLGEAMPVLALLYLMVARAASLARSMPRRTAQGRRALVAILLLSLCACGSIERPPICARAARLTTGEPSDDGAITRAAPELVLTFWCGPPLAELDDARAAEIAAAGFNVIGAPCEGEVTPELNHRALDVAARHGLAMWIADRRIDGCVSGVSGCAERLAEMVADFASHPALAGYFVMDEPSRDDIDVAAAVVDELRRLDPGRLAYVNLLPDYLPAEAFGDEGYDSYLAAVVARTAPRLVSYDHYPFQEEGDRPSFFANLQAVRTAALRAGAEFMLIVQAMPHGRYRDPSEAELSWQVFHALAFGARGISYFAYWTPVEVPRAERWNFRYGLIEKGKPTLHYFQAGRINRAARAFAAELASYRSIAIADSEGEIGSAPPLGPIEAIEGGPVTAGLFRDAAGNVAVLLVNRDYRRGVDALVRPRRGVPPPSLFDPATGRWIASVDHALDLPPGGARLLRFEIPLRHVSSSKDVR